MKITEKKTILKVELDSGKKEILQLSNDKKYWKYDLKNKLFDLLDEAGVEDVKEESAIEELKNSGKFYADGEIDGDDDGVFLKVVVEDMEWYEEVSKDLTEYDLNHRVASTGSIYIELDDGRKVRISNHEPNGKRKDFEVDLSKATLSSEIADAINIAVECNDFEDLTAICF